MQYIKDLSELNITEPACVSLGKFDGLHAGHRYLMEAMEEGRKEGLKCVLFTFSMINHQLGNADRKVLSTEAEKEQIFEDAGVDYMVECPFTEEFKSMEPIAFLELLTSKINVKKIVAGTDFRFGCQRKGDYKLLQDCSKQFGFEAVIVDKKQLYGEDISSSRIRKAVEHGLIEDANELLGYPYFVTGYIAHGNAIGRTIGVPTANLVPPADKLLPPNGVYAVRVLLQDGREYGGICNIGKKPTIEGNYDVGAETFIFDFDEDIYDQFLKVSLLHFQRPERKFGSLDELKNQLYQDIDDCKEYLKGIGF